MKRYKTFKVEIEIAYEVADQILITLLRDSIKGTKKSETDPAELEYLKAARLVLKAFGGKSPKKER